MAPVPPEDPKREQLRALRRRTDRVYGIGMLVMGIFATIVNMSIFTEQSLAQQFSALFTQYGLSDYQRPEGLSALSLVGVIGHPIIYAIALYLTLIVWRRGRLAAWIPLLGAVAAFAFSAALMAIGITLHPELVAATAGTPPVPTP